MSSVMNAYLPSWTGKLFPTNALFWKFYGESLSCLWVEWSEIDNSGNWKSLGPFMRKDCFVIWKDFSVRCLGRKGCILAGYVRFHYLFFNPFGFSLVSHFACLLSFLPFSALPNLIHKALSHFLVNWELWFSLLSLPSFSQGNEITLRIWLKLK